MGQSIPTDQSLCDFESRRKCIITPGFERLLTIAVETGSRLVSHAISNQPSRPDEFNDLSIQPLDPLFLVISDQVFRSSLDLFLLGYYNIPDPSLLLNESVISMSSLLVQFPSLSTPALHDGPISLLSPLHQLARLAFIDEFPFPVRFAIVEVLECVSHLRASCFLFVHSHVLSPQLISPSSTIQETLLASLTPDPSVSICNQSTAGIPLVRFLYFLRASVSHQCLHAASIYRVPL